jgi:hypothetical protein
MMRLTSLLVAFSLLPSAATAYAECSWHLRWHNRMGAHGAARDAAGGVGRL